MIQSLDHPIAAVCTPAGSGAIAVIRVSGTGAVELVEQAWRGRDLTALRHATAAVGHITDDDGRDIDQCVATVFRAPHSFTGQDTVEIGCHGSRYIQRQLLTRLAELGARPAGHGEFSQRAFANGKIDLAQAEGIADLIAAESRAAHRLALSQTTGAFSRKINELRSHLIDLASMLELEIDFSEEDVTFADRTELRRLTALTLDTVKSLADTYRDGRAYKNGIPTAIAGNPNAGKSTLLSAVSAARPKIADYPFTTMEPQLGIVDYRGRGSFVMADIPGIIEGASEGRGLGLRFLRHIERNAVLLFMVPADADDIAAQYAVLSRELEQFNPQLVDKPRVLAVSKSDMLDDELMAEIAKTLPEGIPTVFISSVTGFGIDKLKDLLWKEINDERNMLAAPLPAHRPLDVRHRVAEEDNFIIENPAPEPDDTDDFDFPDDEGDWEYESRLDDEV